MPSAQATGPNLTNVTKMGREGLKYLVVGLLVLMVGRTVLNVTISVLRQLNPPPPAPPTVGFGILPPIAFPTSEASSPTSYRLETATGQLPELEEKAGVYFVPPRTASLLDDQTTRTVAASLGFIFEPQQLSVDTYRFTRQDELEATLDITTTNQHFSLTTNYFARPDLLTNNEPPTTLAAVELLKNFLQSANILDGDVATASGQTELLKSVGSELVPAVSFSETDAIRVDLRRQGLYNNYEALTPLGRAGSIRALVVSGLQGYDNIVDLRYNHFALDYTTMETYPLRPVSQAWQVLKSNEGYIAQFFGEGEAVVRKVSIGYFDSFSYQAYVQPIYVFEGDDGFIGYVPAIDPGYLQSPQL